VSDERLQRLLIRAGDAGRAESEARAWPLVEAAFHARSPAAHRPRVPRAAFACALAALIAVVLAVTPSGSAIADWVRDTIAGNPGAKHAAPALTHLPGGGRLLVHSRAGIWVVNADGSRRLLGRYDGATWSPQGLYVAVWRGHELLAVEPGGRVHWALARHDRVRRAGWSPDGFRIAYLADGLRVVAGDGTGDRLIADGAALVTPRWQPRAPHVVAFAPTRTSVEALATDAGAQIWRVYLHHRIRAMTWTADGRLLVVAGGRMVTAFDGATGRVAALFRLGRGSSAAAIAAAPRGHRIALIANGRGARARAVVVNLGPARIAPRSLRAHRPRARTIFAGAARFDQVAWSPDARWIAISWPAANQWLFVRSTGVPALRAVGGIARQFDPGARRPAFPQLSAWCCSR
jgi:hypothetical protein